MSEPKIGETYLVCPSNIVNEWFGNPCQEVKFCGECGEYNAIKVMPDLPEEKIMRCKCREVKA